MYFTFTDIEDVPTECAACGAHKTLSMRWLDDEFDTGVKDIPLVIHLPAYECEACEAVYPNFRKDVMEAIAIDWVNDIKLGIKRPHVTKH